LFVIPSEAEGPAFVFVVILSAAKNLNKPIAPQLWVPHLGHGFIVVKVGDVRKSSLLHDRYGFITLSV